MKKASFLAAVGLIVFMMFLAAFTSTEPQPKGAAGPEGRQAAEKKAEFERRSREKLQEYDRRLQEFGKKAGERGEALYKDQLKELEASKERARKDLESLRAAGQKATWRMRVKVRQALDDFKRRLERAEGEIKN